MLFLFDGHGTNELLQKHWYKLAEPGVCYGDELGV